MKYDLGDKFKVNGVVCEVRHINNGNAWVFPVVDIESDGWTHPYCLCMGMLDENGYDTKGNRCYRVANYKPVTQ